MNCPKCQHEDYSVTNTTASNTATVTFTITVPQTTTQNIFQFIQFHLNLKCCKAAKKETRIQAQGPTAPNPLFKKTPKPKPKKGNPTQAYWNTPNLKSKTLDFG